MGAIELVEKSQLAERPAMKSGDTVRVHVKVREGDKERIQIFEGVVIGLHRGGTRASFTVRKVSFGQGVERVAGVDEVGRGCLAGPVVAAAVVLHPDRHIPGVADSKAVQASERERLYEKILEHAVAWAVAEADPAEIDRINIHQAGLRA